MPEVRELLDYWEESPPAHEMLQLIATSQFIGWERPNVRKKGGKAGKGKPPGTRRPGKNKKPEVEATDPDEGRIDGAPVSRGKSNDAIIVDSKAMMYTAVSAMSMWGCGKVNVSRKGANGG
jgi:hypothetical protein